MGVSCVVTLRYMLGQRNTAQRCQQALSIELGHLFQRRKFDVLEATPRSVSMNHLCFEQAGHRFGERAVVGVTDAADESRGASRRLAAGVPQGDLLQSAVRLVVCARQPTMQRATVCPSRNSCCHTLHTPSTPRLRTHTL